MSENTMKWVLFCLLATTVPVIYYMFVVGGYLPLIAIVALIFSGHIWGNKLFNAVHLVVYAPVFYLIAKILSRRLSSLSQRWKVAGFVGVSIALVAISFLPLYGLGHNESQGVNLFRLFRSGLLR